MMWKFQTLSRRTTQLSPKRYWFYQEIHWLAVMQKFQRHEITCPLNIAQTLACIMLTQQYIFFFSRERLLTQNALVQSCGIGNPITTHLRRKKSFSFFIPSLQPLGKDSLQDHCLLRRVWSAQCGHDFFLCNCAYCFTFSLRLHNINKLFNTP